MTRTRASLSAILIALIAAAGCQSDDTSRGADAAPRPNVLLILTDDQRWDSMSDLPSVDARAEWARFSESFVNFPLCCPARATFLTGRYAHHTGVETLLDGAKLDESVTIATLLEDAGYRTGLIGKYLNQYPFGRGSYVPPGWDEWAAYEGATEYFDYRLNENGTPVDYGSAPDDYSTDVFAKKAASFITSTDAAQPFFLYLALNAPHAAISGPPVPAPRHQDACNDRPVELPPNFNARDTRSQPAWMDESNDQRPEGFVTQVRAACASLRTVDEVVTALIATLERTKRLEDTFIIFTSDNGFSFGEHRLFGKGHLFEESVRVPLLVSGPEVRPGPVDRLTSNVDIVPTILDWAGVPAPHAFVDGHSFAEAARAETPKFVPTEVLLEGCRTRRTRGVFAPVDDSADAPACGGYAEEMGSNWGLRTATHKYIEYPDGSAQLFDLVADPYEMTNLAGDPSAASILAALRERLHELRDG